MRSRNFRTKSIFETGAPLYDLFANASRFGSRAENLQHLGLDPSRRLIFYGTNHAAHFPDEVEVVKRVARWVEADFLGVPCQLWVRLHPQAVSGPYKVPAEPYRKLASKRVKIEFPPVRDSNLSWDLPTDDIEHLVRLLRDADTVINMASTLSIDAAILDRPVVSIAFDPSGDLPYEKSVRRYYDYTHMSHVVRAGAVQLAKSPDDLRDKIIAYLKHPEWDREGRRRIVEQQFGRVDGQAARRVAEQVMAMVLKRKTNAVLG
jgi:CDP-Glycerol:Poly(glycerophosphate) glycerophosphotransferase